MNRLNLVLSLILIGSGPLASSQVLELRLESDVRQMLPSLPVPLRLVAANRTPSSILLPHFIYVYASRDGAESFVGGERTPWRREPVGEEVYDPTWDGRLSIAPGTTVPGDLSVSFSCEGPSFLLHPFLWTPGRYTLRAIASLDHAQLQDAVRLPTLQDVATMVPDLIVSSPLTIDVMTPQGVDADAWAYLLEVSHGKGWLGLGEPFDQHPLHARMLRERYPASQYSFCFGATNLTHATLADIEALAARLRAATPRPPMLDWLDLTIAGAHSSNCSAHLRVPRDVPAAVEECEEARMLFERAVVNASNLEVRQRASEGLRGTMTADEIRNHVLHRQAVETGSYQALIPFLQCTKESGKSLEARFGYVNPNAFTVYVVAGAMNFFSPDPTNRGQPTEFLPGRHEAAVSVIVDAKKSTPQRSITWTLDGATVAAPSSGAARCKGK